MWRGTSTWTPVTKSASTLIPISSKSWIWVGVVHFVKLLQVSFIYLFFSKGTSLSSVSAPELSVREIFSWWKRSKWLVRGLCVPPRWVVAYWRGKKFINKLNVGSIVGLRDMELMEYYNLSSWRYLIVILIFFRRVGLDSLLILFILRQNLHKKNSHLEKSDLQCTGTAGQLNVKIEIFLIISSHFMKLTLPTVSL